MIELIKGDCMEVMQSFADGQFDLAIVDPPYGIGASKKVRYHANAFTNYKKGNWDNSKPNPEYFKELFRVAKYWIIWGANYFAHDIPICRNWIVWDKVQPEGTTFSMHELACTNIESQPLIIKISIASGKNNSVVRSKAKKRIHQTQKQVSLYRWLLKNYAQKGFKILDTHGGSMSSVIACAQMEYDITCIEIDDHYFDNAVKRVRTEISQLDMFGSYPEINIRKT